MVELIHQAAAASTGGRPFLIYGAAGSGKGLLARGIHYASERHREPFVELDCEGLPEDVLAVELFGGVGGGPDGGTGLLQLAGGGTAFLRHIDAMTPALQSRLAYTLTHGTSARVLASTKLPVQEAGGVLDPNLSRLMGGGDLVVPPLTRRGDDVLLIANEVLLDFGLTNREAPKELAPESVDRLLSHHWPGNARELIYVVTTAAERCPGPVITPADIVIRVRQSEAGFEGDNTIRIPDVGVSLEWIEQEAVRITLRLTDGNKSQAARVLGVSRPTLLKKLRALEERERQEDRRRDEDEAVTTAGTHWTPSFGMDL